MNYSTEAWQNWIAARNRSFADPAGFLSITSLNWLTEEPQAINGLSGQWSSDGETIYVKNSNTGDHQWLIATNDTTIDFDGIKVELANRNDQLVVRPRDPKSPMLSAFEGVLVFDYDPKFAVKATFEAFPEAKEVVVGTVVEGMTSAYVSPGRLHFQLAGQDLSLTAFEKPNSKDLVVYYKDTTANILTYGTGKSVTASYQPDGTYLLDFNYSGNFPCSYTDFATCPVAPIENKLPVAIEAGEKKPLYRHTPEGVISQVH